MGGLQYVRLSLVNLVSSLLNTEERRTMSAPMMELPMASPGARMRLDEMAMRWLENGKIVTLQLALCGMRARHHQVLTQETPACFHSHIMVSPTTPAPGGPGKELIMANTGVPLRLTEMETT